METPNINALIARTRYMEERLEARAELSALKAKAALLDTHVAKLRSMDDLMDTESALVRAYTALGGGKETA